MFQTPKTTLLMVYLMCFSGKFNPITGEPYEDAESPAAAPAAPVVKQQQQQQPEPQQPQQVRIPLLHHST